MDVFCISLEKNKDSWPEILQRIRDNGFPNAKIFPGIVGKNFTNDNSTEVKLFGKPDTFVSTWALFDLKKKKDRRCHEQLGTWGAIGCYLSHLSIWNNFLKSPSNSDRVLIFEDDIDFVSGFETAYQKYIEAVPKSADVIFLDLARNFNSMDMANNVTKVNGQFFGLHAYIITKKAIEKFITHILPIEVQIDAYMSMYAEMNDMEMFTPTIQMCRQMNRPTSIQTVCVMCQWDEKSIRLLSIGGIVVLVTVIIWITRMAYNVFGKKVVKK